MFISQSFFRDKKIIMFVDKLFVEFYVEGLNIYLQKKNTEQTNIVSEPLTFFSNTQH